MTVSTLAAIVATLILFGHISVIVHIFGFKPAFTLSDQLDLVTIVGPVTATYLMTSALGVVALQRGQGRTEDAKIVYIGFCVSLTLIYFFGCHWIVNGAQASAESLELARISLASLETMIGALLAIFVKDLFSAD